MKTIISAIFISLGMIIAGYFVADGIKSGQQFNRYVAVKGMAERIEKANNAVWSLSYTAHANDIKALYRNIKNSQETIKDFLLKAGFKADDINIGSISINTNSSKEESKEALYAAYGNITLTSDDVDSIKKLSQKTDIIIEKGVLLSGGDIKYRFTALNEIKPAMLTQATGSAKIAANRFAENVGASLGSIRQAFQGIFSIKNADDSYGEQNIMKKVRVVVSVQYFIR